MGNLEFRKIPSLKFLYEINSNGTILRNVKSKKHIKNFLDFHHSKTGYWMAFVCIHKKVTRVPIARVVAECWLGKKPEGYEIDHRDRNSRNNDYRNLRYVTKNEQMRNRDHTNIARTGTKNILAYIDSIKKPVHLRWGGTSEMTFESMTRCAFFIAEQTGQTPEHIRYKLKRRRKKIYQYNVEYL